MGHLQTSHLIPAPSDEVFRYVTELQNLSEQLRGHIEVSFPFDQPKLGLHQEFEMVLSRFSVSLHVVARVEAMDVGERFSYRQVTGFFRSWSHTILLRRHDEKTTLLTDLVEFQMPFGILGAVVDDVFVRRDIEKILNDRLRRIEEHFSSDRSESK